MSKYFSSEMAERNVCKKRVCKRVRERERKKRIKTKTSCQSYHFPSIFQFFIHIAIIHTTIDSVENGIVRR